MSGTTNIAVNPNIPAITQPLATAESNTRVLLQVRQAIQSLAGQIGKTSDRAVTFNDLNPQLTGLSSQLDALTQRVTKLEQEFAALPKPP